MSKTKSPLFPSLNLDNMPIKWNAKNLKKSSELPPIINSYSSDDTEELSSSRSKLRFNKFNELDDLLQQDYNQKSEHNLVKIAQLLKEGQESEEFKLAHTEFYNKHINKMQKMGLLGKEKNGKFTAGEHDRIIMHAANKGLNERAAKTSGRSQGEVISQKFPKQGHIKPTKYMAKKGEVDEHLREILGAKFYSHFAGTRGTTTAKTRLLERENGSTEIGSRMLDGYQNYYPNAPNIKNGKLVINDGKQEAEVKGYIAMLVVAKFIQDFDCVGWGANAGYIKESKPRENGRVVHTNAKIDPGKSMGFLNQNSHIDLDPTDNNTSDISLGTVFHLQKKMLNSVFHTHLPLDYLNPNDPSQLRKEIGGIGEALNYYYPNLDSRDLLLGEMTYAEISKSSKLYHQMAKTIYSIANTTDEELKTLINYNVPDTINEQDVKEYKQEILEQLIDRRNMMHKLYAQEVEYMKLYYQAKTLNQEINFEELKLRAEEQAKNAILPQVHMPMNLTLRKDSKEGNNELLVMAASIGNAELVSKLLRNPHDLKKISSNNLLEEEQTPLISAIYSGDVNTADLIITYTSNINNKTEQFFEVQDHAVETHGSIVNETTPLIESIYSNNIEMVNVILKRNPDINIECYQITENTTDSNNSVIEINSTHTALSEAIQMNNPDIVNTILQNGANPNLKLQTHTKTYNGEDLLEEKIEKHSLLMKVIQNQDLESMKTLLKYGANINSTATEHNITYTEGIKLENIKEFSLLSRAIQNDDQMAINAILEHNPDIDKILVCTHIDPNGEQKTYNTALLEAINKGNEYTIEALMNKSPNIENTLLCAIMEGNLDAVKKLIDYQPGINLSKEINGTTYLKEAVKHQDPGITDFLLEKGAVPTRANRPSSSRSIRETLQVNSPSNTYISTASLPAKQKDTQVII